MSQEKSPDWLPAGWSVDLKVRRSGKKDKCYTDPSNELKFYSKPEVLRYLSTKEEISYPTADEKNEGTLKRIEANVVVEKTVTEELPPGWTKEFKVRKQGQKVRKDPYYTDPVTGYVFRSLKDVHRYLKTGVLGKHAFKPKEDSRADMELDDENLTVHAATVKEKSAEGINGQITAYQSSKLVETGKDELIIESTNKANHSCISESASEPCRENGGSDNLPNGSGLKAREVNCEITADKELNEGKAKQNVKKSNEKSKPSMPRRASKRLAGVEIDLPREIKTRRQAATKRVTEVGTSIACLATPVERGMKVVTDDSPTKNQVDHIDLPRANNISGEEEAGGEIKMDNNPGHGQDRNNKTDDKPEETQDGNVETDDMPEEGKVVMPSRSLHISVEYGENLEKESKRSRKQKSPTVSGEEIERCAVPKEGKELPCVSSEEHDGEVKTADTSREVLEQPSSNFITPEECGLKVENNNIPNGKQEKPIVSPPSASTAEGHYRKGDCENKPCDIVFSPQNLLIPEEHTGKMEIDNKVDMKPESPVNFSLTDLWADPCIEFAVKTLTGAIPVGDENKAENYPASPLDLPLGELWTDPCIEFAVKTLTGAIPVGEDISVQDYFQQHACSTENGENENGFMLPDSGLNNLCQTEYLSQHFDTAENAQKKQEFVVPMLPTHRNSSLQHPGGTSLPQHMNGKHGQYSRPTFF